LTNEKQERLVKSILAKVSESNYQETSPNKFLKRVFNLMDPVISNQRLWRVLSELEKPWKPELSDGNHISSRAQTVQNKEPKSKGSSSIFAEALPIPTPRKLSPMRTRVLLDMAEKENNFSTQLESSGLSKTHAGLSEKFRSIEMKTRVRRAQPLYPSQVLGDSYQYGGKQLARKAPRHLIDFGISTEGKTVEEMSMEYKDVAEMLLSKPKLVIHEEGTLNKQEPTINIGDPESLGIVSFENNPLYDKHHFISCYIVSQKAFDDFVETGEIGISPEERKMKIDAFQKKQAQAEREKENAHSFYSSLPQDARIGNKQLGEAEALKQKLKEDPKFQLTEKEKNMIQRAEKYQQSKNQYYQNNPDIDKDEI